MLSSKSTAVSSLVGIVLTGIALANLFLEFHHLQSSVDSLGSSVVETGLLSTEMNATSSQHLLSSFFKKTKPTTLASFKESRVRNSTGTPMYNLHKATTEVEDTASTKESFHLESTFDGLHDFDSDGPRRGPFSLGLSIPELLLQGSTKGTDDEVDFFQTKGAYYAAAWLSTTATFLTNANLDFEAIQSKRSSTDWNLEAGTWVGIRNRTNHRSIDMFDFFVHHLSRYKGPNSVRGPHQPNWNMYLRGLDSMQRSYEQRPFNNPSMDRNGRVLVICPFHETSDNHSGQDEKRLHLNVTIKALARVFPNVVVTVCDEANLDYVTNESGLNEYLYDVLLIKNLSMAPVLKCTHLPFLSNVQVRRLLQRGYYSADHFDWIYFTESDQPPHLTSVNALLKQALCNSRSVVVPHRSYPVALARELNVSWASKGTKQFLQSNSDKLLHRVDDLREHSCCFRPPPFLQKEWGSPDIQLFQQYDAHAQATGFCNPFRKTCTTCTFRNRAKDGPCPNFSSI
ncbi:MAG: hypothetical protein SGBAC_009482 [Bacillariaceae sp.]